VDDALSRRTQGSGLGLYIAKAIVEAHGGRIWVNSAPGLGTAITFSLPRDESPG
jgi:signal transduction histidine kinase